MELKSSLVAENPFQNEHPTFSIVPHLGDPLPPARPQQPTTHTHFLPSLDGIRYVVLAQNALPYLDADMISCVLRKYLRTIQGGWMAPVEEDSFERLAARD